MKKCRKLTPQNLNNLIIAREGCQKSRIPPTPKSHPTVTKKAPKWDPNWAIGAQKALQGPSKTEQKTEKEKDSQQDLKINPPASGQVQSRHVPLPEPHPYWYNILGMAGRYKGGDLHETSSCAPLRVTALPVIRQPPARGDF